MDRTRICHVVPSIGPKSGGFGTSIPQTCAYLRRLGCETKIASTGRMSGQDGARGEMVFPVRWPGSWNRSPELVRWLSGGIESIDLLCLNGIWDHPLQAAARIARRHDIPYTVTPRGTFMHPWRYGTLKKRIYLALIGNRMIKGAACMHATAEAEIQGFRDVGYRGPVTMVPNGIDPAEFAELPDSAEAEETRPELRGRRVLLFMSRLSPEKGLDQLVPAWADITRGPTYSDCVLVLAGPDDRGYASTVEAMVAREGVGQSVMMTGMIRGREKLALYRRADVFVLPSHSENFGLVVAEALASGTPVVTTTGTPWRELAEIDAGRWVPPERDALAEALRELLDMDPARRGEMGRRGRKLVFEKYTWELAARRLVTVYDCILKGREVPLHPEPVPVDAEGKAVLP